ncbi:hypothetical protein GCM10027428_33810 [Haliea atlantica]
MLAQLVQAAPEEPGGGTKEKQRLSYLLQAKPQVIQSPYMGEFVEYDCFQVGIGELIEQGLGKYNDGPVKAHGEGACNLTGLQQGHLPTQSPLFLPMFQALMQARIGDRF